MEKDLCASGIVILLFLVAMMALALLYSTLLSLSEWVSECLVQWTEQNLLSPAAVYSASKLVGLHRGVQRKLWEFWSCYSFSALATLRNGENCVFFQPSPSILGRQECHRASALLLLPPRCFGSKIYKVIPQFCQFCCGCVTVWLLNPFGHIFASIGVI